MMMIVTVACFLSLSSSLPEIFSPLSPVSQELDEMDRSFRVPRNTCPWKEHGWTRVLRAGFNSVIF